MSCQLLVGVDLGTARLVGGKRVGRARPRGGAGSRCGLLCAGWFTAALSALRAPLTKMLQDGAPFPLFLILI